VVTGQLPASGGDADERVRQTVDDGQAGNIHRSTKKKTGTVWGDSGGTGLLGCLRLQGLHAFSECYCGFSSIKTKNLAMPKNCQYASFFLDVHEFLWLDEGMPKDRAKNCTVFGSDDLDATSSKAFKLLDVHVVVVLAQRSLSDNIGGWSTEQR